MENLELGSGWFLSFLVCSASVPSEDQDTGGHGHVSSVQQLPVGELLLFSTSEVMICSHIPPLLHRSDGACSADVSELEVSGVDCEETAVCLSVEMKELVKDPDLDTLVLSPGTKHPVDPERPAHPHEDCSYHFS